MTGNDKIFAVIFDMDGVITDNNLYHRQAWKEFCSSHSFFLSEDEFQKHVFGKINKDILNYLFNRELSGEEIEKYGKEKEEIYRTIYKPNIKLPDGLLNLLDELKLNNIKTAIATSAPKENVDFIFSNLDIEKYFNVVVDESQITKGKPDPEIYLLASRHIGIKPEFCIVIEDSISGIKSAKSAGMKVIAITTTHSKETLGEADFVIDSFTELSIRRLLELVIWVT